MSKVYCLLLIIFVPGCGASQNIKESNNSLFFEFNNNIVKITQYQMEGMSTCPKLELLSEDKKQLLDTIEICFIKIPGYREFDVTKDFAFIEFSHFEIKNQGIYYDIDLAILRGKAFSVNCEVRLHGKKIIQSDCKEILD